ncbi:hypothetical protein CSC2_26690 [Clostridium zeae]|uniref:DUF2019 domain-containing protein n=1 Tax=Clostridium zeae TaxID=2759022 RepID=A0ABQ1EBR0_9CLOT|nr:DUF2019 domain-containing protein [Clostridium zeae]GFZ32143.1 hypothetical protein CSC2_26690 [Clostridium zeae]
MDGIQQIIQDFIEASIKQEEATLAGKHKVMNKRYSEIKDLTAKLRELGDNSLEVLIPLLSHENSYVRYNASFAIIPINPEKAKEVIKEISQQKSSIGFTAMMVLRELENGNLKLMHKFDIFG